MSIKIALAGNPNSGKTTVFNELTGSSQYVGNWPGVTVEKKEGKLKGYKDIRLVDLPGIYSLSPYSLEEVVSRKFLANERPDAIINIVDASNLERNLYLTTQLLELDIPLIIALNMIDIVEKNGDYIDIKTLSKKLGCEIIETSALKNKGLKELAAKAVDVANKKDLACKIQYNECTESALEKISELIPNQDFNNRFIMIKLFERDKEIFKELKNKGIDIDTVKLEEIIKQTEDLLDDDSESLITCQRYDFINNILKGTYKKKPKLDTVSDKIDRVVTNRWLALPIFFVVMFLVYFIAIQSMGKLTVTLIEEGFASLGNIAENWLESIDAAIWLRGLIVEGIINGVGSVLVFVPQLFILFFFISLLEDCGYMARVAFIMDRIFRHFGLSGKSFIPMLLGTGCSVPAIMSTRTIESDKDRKMTIMLTPFVPCGAKLPVFALIAGALFNQSAIITASLYFVGIIMVVISGIILKKTRLFKGDPAPFVMELPPYRVPAPKGVVIHMWDRGKDFIVKAGTVIFVACGIIWTLSSFNWTFNMVDTADSMIADIGKLIAPIFTPLGFGSWEAAVATLTGFVAKENIVATFGILFGIEVDAEQSMAIWSNLAQLFTSGVAGYSFLVFTLFAPPCFAAISATKREMGGYKWMFIAIAFQLTVAYITSFLVYQIGSLIFLGGSPLSTAIIAAAIVLLMAYIIYRNIRYKKSGCCGSCSGCSKTNCK